MSIDQREFRNTLGTFATGITIITTQTQEGSLVGVTINSFASVSLDPPMVLFSLNRESPLREIFLKSEHFNVCVLSQDQEKLSNLFASPDPNKFDKVDWNSGQNGMPVLNATLATLECTRQTTYEGGDHTIFIGEVTHHESNAQGKPLLYFNGGYAKIGS